MEQEKIKEIKKALESCSTLNEDITVREWLQENQQLKDRISELEKVYDRQVRIINDLNIEVVKEQEKLPKFAERLKEELEEYCLENEYFTEHEPNGNLWQLNASVFCIEVTQDGGLVDKTLKEFIDEKPTE